MSGPRPERQGALRWVIAGGGTGGHVMPALALGKVLRDDGEAVRFIGATRGMETRLVPEAGFELVTLGSRPLVGRNLLERWRALAALVLTTFQAWRNLRGFGADLVVSVGGYAAVPVALAARLRGTPLVLVEPNAFPGVAHRAMARFARRLFVFFDSAGAALGRGADDPRIRATGIPLRGALVKAFHGAEPARRPAPPFRLFAFGGSQGARQINEVLVAALPKLTTREIRIVHQTGEADLERVRDAYARAGVEAEVVAFEHDMVGRYRWADLVLCRAGALTVAELALAGRPALLVPLAHTGGGEQRANARALEEVGAAAVLDGDRVTPDGLAEELGRLLADPDRLQRMGIAASRLARPHAARAIVDESRALLAEGIRR